MFKTMVLIRKKKGMATGDFISYYEKTHAPLAAGIIPGLRKYARHFIRPYGPEPDQSDQPYDVVTEMWYEDQAAFETCMATLSDPPIAKIIVADEEQLFERSSISFMVIETRETKL